MGVGGAGGRMRPELPSAGGHCGSGLGAEGRFLQFFNKNNAFNAYFGRNSYYKATTHQLKAFKSSLNELNRINEVQVLYIIRINVTKYDVAFTTRWGGGEG